MQEETETPSRDYLESAFCSHTFWWPDPIFVVKCPSALQISMRAIVTRNIVCEASGNLRR